MHKHHDPRPLVARRIRLARQLKGMTQSQLAAKIGVSYQLIQQYEHGHKLSLDRLISLAIALEVEVAWLLTGTLEKLAAPAMIGSAVVLMLARQHCGFHV